MTITTSVIRTASIGISPALRTAWRGCFPTFPSIQRRAIHGSLSITEKLLLLGFDEKTKRPLSWKHFDTALGAAVIMDLYSRNQINLIEQNELVSKRLIVRPLSKKAIEHPVLNKCLSSIQNTWFGSEYPIEDWIKDFSERSISRQTIDDLSRKGVLTKRVDHYCFGLFWLNRYEEDSSTAIVNRLREVVMGNSEEVDCQTTVLLTLCKKVKLLERVFTKDELAKNSDRIEKIMSGQLALRNLESYTTNTNAMKNVIIMYCVFNSHHLTVP